MGPLPLERVRTLVSCVWVLESDGKYWAQGMLYKLGLLNRPELNKFYYLSYILGWKEGARMESSNLSWYWRIVSSSWRFIPPFTFGSCSYLWKSLLPLNNNYWLFLIYCAWCIVVYWCNSYTIVHCSLDIIEWFKYKLKKVLNCTWYWFIPLSVSTHWPL